MGETPYPCFSRSSPFSSVQAARVRMALPLFVLMVCLLLSLVLLWRHDWLYLRPSSRGGAKRGTFPRLFPRDAQRVLPQHQPALRAFFIPPLFRQHEVA